MHNREMSMHVKCKILHVKCKILHVKCKILHNPKVNQTLVPQAFDPFDPVCLIYLTLIYTASLGLSDL